MEKEQGYKKRRVILIIETSVGDKWMNRKDCDFENIGDNGYLVELRNQKIKSEGLLTATYNE